MRGAIPNRPTLSLIQVMKLVIFCAVAFACVTPMLNLWHAGVVQGGSLRGLVFVALFEAILVPVAWVVVCLFLVRRGPRRDRLITGLLLCPVAIALGLACWMVISYTIPAFGNPADPPEKRVGASFVTLHVLALLALAAAALFLSLRLRRGPRPQPSA